MSELAKLMVKAGVFTPDQLEQFKRWGVQNLDAVPEAHAYEVNEFLKEVELALENEDQVFVRETDFTALHEFLKKQHQGVLHLDTGITEADNPVSYAILRTGEYIIPWTGENVFELMANGRTYLFTHENQQVTFAEVRELFYGGQKAFMVCRPSPLEIDYKDKLPPALNGGTNGSHTPEDSSQD